MAEPKAKTSQERFGFIDNDLKKPEHDEMIRWLDTNIEDVLMLVFNLQNRPKEVQTKWEPVVRQRPNEGQLIGFVDLIVGFFCPPELDRYYVDGFGRCRVVFEAKTKFESLGTLFRQVRMYQEGYIGELSVARMPFVILCPDDTEAEIIRQQRLYFLKYDPKIEFKLGGV